MGKFPNIQRHKDRMDAARAATFAKTSRAIIVAARQGGGDPAGNFQLRTAIDKAKAAGMPNDNIDRAIAKGSGNLSGDNLEALRYEGYGPGGVAILIEALTDNRNRTAADLRTTFGKNGGNLGETGCVGWMFDQTGVVTLTKPGQGKAKYGAIAEDDLLEIALEGGADSYELITLNIGVDDDVPAAALFTEIANLESLSQFLKDQGFTVIVAEPRWIPNNTVTLIDAEQIRLLLRLLDSLDDLDDVQSVTANAELADQT
jgi:YebC/PmpR family DNA-binding regulatory protein